MSLKHIALIFCAFLIAACASKSPLSQSAQQVQLPSNSVASTKEALAHDMLALTDQYIQAKYACNHWTLIGVPESKIANQLVFTRDGQLYQGQVTETWNLSQCDQALSINLEIEARGDTGKVIRIKKRP